MSLAPFRGGPLLKLDEKSRLTVPTRFKVELMKEEVAGRLVVTKNQRGCLSIYPLPVWERLEAQLLALPWSEDGWRRLLVGSATDVEIDGSGRVLIPPELKEWAGMGRDVQLMGVGKYFELWDSEKYAVSEAQTLASEPPAALRDLVIL
jgi:MraZ protein